MKGQMREYRVCYQNANSLCKSSVKRAEDTGWVNYGIESAELEEKPIMQTSIVAAMTANHANALVEPRLEVSLTY